MSYWFEDPTLKALAPLALSTSIKGLSTLFFTPRIYAGYNVIPQGPVIGSTTIDPLVNRCAKKRAFRDGKALGAAEVKLEQGEELTFFLMIAGG